MAVDYSRARVNRILITARICNLRKNNRKKPVESHCKCCFYTRPLQAMKYEMENIWSDLQFILVFGKWLVIVIILFREYIIMAKQFITNKTKTNEDR